MRLSPPDCATLLIVDLDELPKAAGVVVMSRLSVPKGLKRKQKGLHISTHRYKVLASYD